jgi:branched-chain amino acid transport system substrate-binding protein
MRVMPVNTRKTLALTTTLAIVAVACTTEQGSAPTQRKRTAPEICREDQFGCVHLPPGNPIRLAAMVPFDVRYVGAHKRAALAMTLAVELRRPLLGRQVVLARRSDDCTGHSHGVLGRLASDPTIAAVIGVGCQNTSEIAGPMLSEKGVVFVSTTSNGPGLTRPARRAPFFLRTAHNDGVQGTAIAAFARERLHLSTAATTYEKRSSAHALAARFDNEFARLGGRTVYREAYRGWKPLPPGRLLARIQKADPAFVYAPVFFHHAAILAGQMRERPEMRSVAFGVGYGIRHPDWLDVTGSSAEGVYVTEPRPEVQDPRFEREFLPTYERRFGMIRHDWQWPYLANAYDATNMVLDAIEDVTIEDTSTGGLYIPRTWLRDRMFATKDFQGLSGTLSCDENGDCNHSTPVVIYQVRNGKFRKAWTWRPPG